MKQILDQIQALLPDSTSRTSPWPPIEPSGQLSTLKALTEQLKRGTRTSAARPSPPAADPTGSLSPELDGRVDLVLKELQSLNRKIDSNLQLLQPYVTLLRMAQQVRVWCPSGSAGGDPLPSWPIRDRHYTLKLSGSKLPSVTFLLPSTSG